MVLTFSSFGSCYSRNFLWLYREFKLKHSHIYVVFAQLEILFWELHFIWLFCSGKVACRYVFGLIGIFWIFHFVPYRGLLWICHEDAPIWMHRKQIHFSEAQLNLHRFLHCFPDLASVAPYICLFFFLMNFCVLLPCSIININFHPFKDCLMSTFKMSYLGTCLSHIAF